MSLLAPWWLGPHTWGAPWEVEHYDWHPRTAAGSRYPPEVRALLVEALDLILKDAAPEMVKMVGAYLTRVAGDYGTLSRSFESLALDKRDNLPAAVRDGQAAKSPAVPSNARRRRD